MSSTADSFQQPTQCFAHSATWKWPRSNTNYGMIFRLCKLDIKREWIACGFCGLTKARVTITVFVHLALYVLKMKSTSNMAYKSYDLCPVSQPKLNRFQCKQRSIDYQLKIGRHLIHHQSGHTSDLRAFKLYSIWSPNPYHSLSMDLCLLTYSTPILSPNKISHDSHEINSRSVWQTRCLL